jgi:hypothetical protein
MVTFQLYCFLSGTSGHLRKSLAEPSTFCKLAELLPHQKESLAGSKTYSIKAQLINPQLLKALKSMHNETLLIQTHQNFPKSFISRVQIVRLWYVKWCLNSNLTSIFSSNSCKNSPSTAELDLDDELLAHMIARESKTIRFCRSRSVLQYMGGK